MPDFRATPLYGGAIVADLPSNFADVSNFRQVPDHQEVWVDKDGFTSIIFDILERVGEPGSNPEIDGRALTTHIQDVAGGDDVALKIWNTANTRFSRLDPKIPAFTLIATSTPRTPPSSSTSAAPDFTAIIMSMLRLEEKDTDILITINVPHIKGEYDEDAIDMELGKQGELIGNAVDFSAKIWESFNIKDWNLFPEVEVGIDEE